VIRPGTAFATALLLVAPPLHAQQFSLRLGGLRTQYADSLDAGAGSLAAQVAWAGTRAQGILEASWSQFNTGKGAGQMWGSVAAMGPRSRHAGLGVRADGVTNAIAGSTWTATGTTELFGALTSGGWTLAMGVDAGGVRSIDTARFATAGAAVRAWYQHGDWTIGAAASTTTSRYAHFTDVAASADFRRGRVMVGVVASARRGDLGGAPWYQGRASVRLIELLSLEAALGSYPKDLAGYDRGRYAHLGLRVQVSAPRRSAVTLPASAAASGRLLIEALDSANTRVTFALADVGAPAIVGSWNQWSPEPLARTGDGRWSAILPIGAGTFRFALVMDDGRWMVPDGVTRLPDDFDGEVGILVVSSR
jgi:hypothetical protein